MIAVPMPRKRITLNVDTRIADALATVADNLGISMSRVGELELSQRLKDMGALPEDYKPLGETRGGDFTSKKKGGDRTATNDEGAA